MACFLICAAVFHNFALTMPKLLKIFPFLLVFLTASVIPSCKKDYATQPYKTRNLFIVVIDGPRYSETWGDAKHVYIPNYVRLSKQGTVFTNMYNQGFTYTTCGHTALTTGVYQNINNGGYEYPKEPSYLQHWLEKTGNPSSDAWVITTKDKLQVLSDCVNPQWKNRYLPMTDCGVSGLFTGYRNDSTTFAHIKKVITDFHPRLMFVNFKEPDASGHANNWNKYLQGIVDTDKYIGELWDMLQENPIYRGNTTLFVTNDHGRHLDGWLDGFVSHGDTCAGCRHINLLALGPDFRQDCIDATPYSQVDICATAAELMGIQMPASTGKVMHTLVLKQVSKD